jgi:hypothetical protein
MKIKKFAQLNESFKDDKTGMNLDQMMNFQSTYKGRVRDSLFNIICDEEGISEKDFTKLDYLIEYLEKYYEENKENVDEIISAYEKQGLRVQYCAERLYSEYK